MTSDPPSIPKLREHAENQARLLRYTAIGLGVLSLALLVAIVVFVLSYEPTSEVTLSWGITRLAAAVAVAALLLLASRIVWNYSNVWLGRAGTLEDLWLALIFLEVNVSNPTISGGKASELLQIAESLERLRRSFEGELLKGPSLQVPEVK